MGAEVHQRAMRNVVLPVGNARFSVDELDAETAKYELQLRQAAVQSVYAAVSPEEQDMLDSEVIIHNGVSASSREYCVFLFLCVAARARPGSTPFDIARDIERAKSAVRILLR